MLGKIVTGSGIAPDLDLICDMVDFPVPHNSKQVMWFLGLCGVYQNFIRDFQLIAKPLHDLTHKKVAWRWGKIENKAFVVLKNAMVSDSVLKHPDFTKPFIIFLDALVFRGGAVLTQLYSSLYFLVSYASWL